MWSFTKWVFRNWKITFPLLLVLAAASYVTYDFFRWETMRVVILNTPVKRNPGSTDDKFRVNYAPVVNGKIDISNADQFENTDAWFFLKWNSGKVDSQMTALAKTEAVVDVRVYGWRWGYLSWYKNIISFEEVSGPVK